MQQNLLIQAGLLEIDLTFESFIYSKMLFSVRHLTLMYKPRFTSPLLLLLLLLLLLFFFFLFFSLSHFRSVIYVYHVFNFNKGMLNNRITAVLVLIPLVLHQLPTNQFSGNDNRVLMTMTLAVSCQSAHIHPFPILFGPPQT